MRLADDRRGVAAVQFALLAPALFLLLLGTFEFAIMIFISGTLESAVLSAARYGITGLVEGG